MQHFCSYMFSANYHELCIYAWHVIIYAKTKFHTQQLGNIYTPQTEILATPLLGPPPKPKPNYVPGNANKCPKIPYSEMVKKMQKLIRNPHADPHQHKKLITSRGSFSPCPPMSAKFGRSALARPCLPSLVVQPLPTHVCQVWSFSPCPPMSAKFGRRPFPCLSVILFTEWQTERRNDHITCALLVEVIKRNNALGLLAVIDGWERRVWQSQVEQSSSGQRRTERLECRLHFLTDEPRHLDNNNSLLGRARFTNRDLIWPGSQSEVNLFDPPIFVSPT